MSAPGRTPLERPVEVLVVDGQRAIAQAIARALSTDGRIHAAAASTPAEAAAAVERARPDVLVMDTGTPGAIGLARRIGGEEPLPLVVLSERLDDVVRARSLEVGARGFLSRREPFDAVAAAVLACADGILAVEPAEAARLRGRAVRPRSQHASERQRAARLSAREREVLQLIADGATAAEAARRLGISRETARTHVQNILTKLGVHSRTQAVVLAVRQGKVTTRA